MSKVGGVAEGVLKAVEMDRNALCEKENERRASGVLHVSPS